MGMRAMKLVRHTDYGEALADYGEALEYRT